MTFYLKDHVHACAVEEGIVLLDLDKDRYYGLSVAASRCLDGLIAGWPGGGDLTRSPVSAHAQQLIGRLLAAGILTGTCPAASRTIHLPPPRIDAGGQPSESIACLQLGGFLLACASAAVKLRFLSLGSVIESVARRKARAARRNVCFDEERALKLSSVFARLRPWIFASRNRCLFHALALLDFLALHGQFPAWVLGVKTFPFAAHSWIQQGSTVFDERGQELAAYRVILAV